MIRRSIVSLASLAWSFGVVALVLRHMPATPQPPVTPILQSSTPVDMAINILQNAERFSSAGVGYAGITPNEVMAWRVLFFRADADSTFQNLLETATPAGEPFLLAGRPPSHVRAFARAAARLPQRLE